MRESFEIASASGEYPVEIGLDAAERIVNEAKDAIFIVDTRLADKFAYRGVKLIMIDANEGNKSLELMPNYVDALRNAGTRRSTHLVAVGGGIIQDITTFLASIYMRGLTWTYLPTTTLAMVDSCIGGKSSINVLGHKNLVGNFYPPQQILIDLNFVTSLDREMVIGGLLEAAKICFAFGPDKFDDYLALSPENARSPEQIGPLVNLALRTKKWFIEIDEFDQAERLLLNFGHTFGHSIEAATHFAVSHGVAVGLGMAIACAFASQDGQLSAKGHASIDRLMRHVHQALAALETDAAFVKAPIDIAMAMEKFEFDKKHTADAFRVVVPCSDGPLQLTPIPRDEITRIRLAQAYLVALQTIGWPHS